MNNNPDPLSPWDGRHKFVEPSAEYVPCLYRLEQLIAGSILRDGSAGLNCWEASFLQGILYRPGVLSDLGRARLSMLEKRIALGVV